MILLILIINTLALVAWGNYLHHLDEFTTDKKNEHKLFCFVIIGSIASIILTLFINSLWEDILYYLTGLRPDENAFVEHILITGPVEELSKFLVFIALAGIFKSIKEPRDGILQAVSVGLGFALLENFIYALFYGIPVLIVRTFLSTVGHMSYAVIWGFGWAATVYTSNNNKKSPDRFYIIPFLVFAAFFHGLSNTFLIIGYPLLTIMVDLLTMSLFFLIYRYVKDNSPYRKYSLKEYKKAITTLTMGLNRYPESCVLNKRLGIFNIYTCKYKEAEKYLRKAKNIKTRSASAGFYFGAAMYLNGKTSKGIDQMNKAMMYLTAEKREMIVASLAKIVTNKSEKDELIGRYNLEKTLFETEEERPRPSDHNSKKNNPLTILVEGWEYARKAGVSSGISGDEICTGKKERKRTKLRKKGRYKGSYLDDFDNRGTWERLIKERPGPVILKPYYLKKGESVVTSLGKADNK